MESIIEETFVFIQHFLNTSHPPEGKFECDRFFDLITPTRKRKHKIQQKTFK